MFTKNYLKHTEHPYSMTGYNIKEKNNVLSFITAMGKKKSLKYFKCLFF